MYYITSAKSKLLLSLCGLALIAPQFAQAQTPATQPSAMQQERAAIATKINALFHGNTMATAKGRASIAAAATPLLYRLIEIDTHNAEVAPPASRSAYANMVTQYKVILLQLGDTPTIAKNDEAARGSGATADGAKAMRIAADFANGGNPAESVKAITTVLESSPSDAVVNHSVVMMYEDDAATAETKTALTDLLSRVAKGPEAASIIRRAGAEKVLRDMENKPLVIEGPQPDGKKLSTADWKGKVILVDFWASWCVPCKKELPRVEKIYTEYHDKGLEVLGVSCDYKAAAFAQFVAATPEMPWPQLYDPANPGWNPIATRLSIEAIPRMFLIDKKGILRTVDARSKMETLIPALLSEKE